MARSKWGEEDEGFVLGEKMLTGDHREKKLMEMNTRSRCEDIVIASYLKKKPVMLCIGTGESGAQRTPTPIYSYLQLFISSGSQTQLSLF